MVYHWLTVYLWNRLIVDLWNILRSIVDHWLMIDLWNRLMIGLWCRVIILNSHRYSITVMYFLALMRISIHIIIRLHALIRLHTLVRILIMVHVLIRLHTLVRIITRLHILVGIMIIGIWLDVLIMWIMYEIVTHLVLFHTNERNELLNTNTFILVPVHLSKNEILLMVT